MVNCPSLLCLTQGVHSNLSPISARGGARVSQRPVPALGEPALYLGGMAGAASIPFDV